ncbi:MAG: NAD-binding protein, partial [Firmicutes bacterium]|nr:NAD-binding protein [Bacillota bacterium]
MKIIVVGNGKIGSLISEQLVQEGHDVVAVDTQEQVLRSLQNRLDLMCIQ